MSEQNPYQPPAANIEMAVSPGQLSGAKGVSVGRGLSWYGEGFDLFKQIPGSGSSTSCCFLSLCL